MKYSATGSHEIQRVPTSTVLVSLLGLASTSCSLLDALPEPVSQAPKLAAVTADLKRVAAETKLTNPLEVAGPIEARPATVAPWIFCLRSRTPDLASRQTYALFYRDLKLVSYRFSAIVDRCDEQPFSPF